MDVSIYFKKADQWRHYTVDDAEFKKLQTDYQHFLDGKSTKGGSYTMANAEAYADTKPRIVMLNFDDISFG